MQNQQNPATKEISILDEIFMEGKPACFRANCSCRRCNSIRSLNNKPMFAEIRRLGWELNNEEEYELGKAFEKIKAFAKRSYNKAKPWIVTADIIRRLIHPHDEPIPVMKDIVTYTEQDKKRKMQERVERAQSGRNIPPKVPVPEISIMHEIFMEADLNRK